MDFLPIDANTKVSEVTNVSEYNNCFQNKHPLLGWYKHDLNTGELSYDKFCNVMQPENDFELMNLLTEIGVIAELNSCLLCGGHMNKFNPLNTSGLETVILDLK